MAIAMLNLLVSRMAAGRQRIIHAATTTSRILDVAASPSPSHREQVRGMVVGNCWTISGSINRRSITTATCRIGNTVLAGSSCSNISCAEVVAVTAAVPMAATIRVHPPTTASAATHISSSNMNTIQIRHFGRKASKLGHHLETAEDLASRPDRIAAKNRRKKKKEQKKHKKGGGGHAAQAEDTGSEESEEDDEQQASDTSTMAAMGDEVDLEIEQDATETTFEHGSDDDIPFLPDTDDVKNRMVKVVTAMEESFRAIRGAEPTPELFDSISVRAYGELTPLSSVAQVVITSPNQATLTCYDPETAPAVRDAVRDSGLNFNPRIEEGDGGVVIVPMPKVSMETRKTLARQLGKAAESSRQRVRRIRRAAQDVVKKGKDGKLEGVSKDDAFRVGKDIDAVTEEVVTLLNRKVEEKQNSVMAV